MSIHEWIPDNHPRSSEQEQPSAPLPYMFVPPLLVGKDDRANTAGWSEPIPGDTFVCETCKKQMRAQFSGLLIFPLFKANIDLFQFTYVMPQHESGEALSKEICKQSGTNMTRNIEHPTHVRFLARDQTPANEQGEEPTRATESAPRESEDDPMAILKTRLAKGEIAEKEFERLAKIVGEPVGPAAEATQEEADSKGLEEEVKKKLDSLSPQMAEERYDYLNSRPISELTDAEYEERLALVQKLSEKHTRVPKKKSK